MPCEDYRYRLLPFTLYEITSMYMTDLVEIVQRMKRKTGNIPNYYPKKNSPKQGYLNFLSSIGTEIFPYLFGSTITILKDGKILTGMLIEANKKPYFKSDTGALHSFVFPTLEDGRINEMKLKAHGIMYIKVFI